MQEVLLKYIRSNIIFESEAHEKAWFIRVTINACNDLRRLSLRKKEIPLNEALDGITVSIEDRDILLAVLSMKSKYRDVIYLRYYEGYSVSEIAGILHKNENTVYSLLNRGRTQLRESLGGDVQ